LSFTERGADTNSRSSDAESSRSNNSPAKKSRSSESNLKRSPNASIPSESLDADYTTNEEGYEVIYKPESLGIKLPPRQDTFRGQPLSQEQWLNYMDNDGRLPLFSKEIKTIIFHGVQTTLPLQNMHILCKNYHSKTFIVFERFRV